MTNDSSDPIALFIIWANGGQYVDSDEDLDNVVSYIYEAQDRMGRGK